MKKSILKGKVYDIIEIIQKVIDSNKMSYT